MPPFSSSKRRIIVIGVGNSYAGDDAAGLHVAERLQKCASGFCRVIKHNGEGTSLMDCWKDTDTVVMVDAANSGAQPGTIHRFDASSAPLPGYAVHESSHSFSVAGAIELSRALGQLPRQVIVYGIEGLDFALGKGLSPMVEDAVELTSDLLIREIEKLLAIFISLNFPR